MQDFEKIKKGFYTYYHCDVDGVPFYVGKGSGNRAYDLNRRNPFHQRKINKIGKENIKILLFPCKDEDEAFANEILQIKELSRSGVKLTNLCDGGKNPSNNIRRAATVRVSIKVSGKLHKLELIPQPWKGRYWLRYNGKNSGKMPECTISKLMDECRKIIVKSEKEQCDEPKTKVHE